MEDEMKNDSPRFVDEPTTGIAYSDELFQRNIAIARGSAGTFAVRAHQVLVRVDTQAELRSATDAIKQLGLVSRRPKGFQPGRGRRLLVEVEPKLFEIDSVERWSVVPVHSAISDLAELGVDAAPNYVSFAHPGSFLPNPGSFLPNPGSFLPNPGSFLPNPGSFLPNPGSFLPNPAPPTTFAQPAPPPPQWRKRIKIAGRHRPVVLVLDTGIATGTTPGGKVRPRHSWLNDALSIHTPWRDDVPGAYDDEDEADDNADGLVDLTAGHGTFIAGIIRQHCPEAIIHSEGVLSGFGDGDDDGISAGIVRAIERIGADNIDVIVMSFGTNTDDDAPPPMADTLAHYVSPQTLLVASAGNSGTTRRQFPAALPGVVAVGALDTSERAGFSNFGGWVDACAPGVDVVSTYFTDVQEQQWPLRRFDGWATWSGTSFTAPKVAAAVCAEMFLNDESAVESWERLSHWTKFRVPDLGIVVNI